MVTHEVGCSNQGQIVTKHRFPKNYIGVLKDTRRVAFQTALEPGRYYFPEYVAVIGPFKTKRAAVWGAANPFNWSRVSEAELMAKKEIRQ